ncbi:MAG TPA: NAD(P)-binding domain-containing protein [Gemmatimonadaceae bacterium]|nr:NAD(P)-binding domain-containing protein [Gemmatimonadaceae bacterium]
MSVPPSIIDRGEHFCIVGAGPSGLGTARAFVEAGIPFELFDRHDEVGGIWDLDNERTPMYETAHFISSRTLSGFDGFPMPDDYPDYPGWRHIRDYLRAFATRYDLRRHIHFRTSVERVAPAAEGRWDVTLSTGETRRYAGVVLGVGHNWDARLPAYPGCFDGEAYHSFHYRSPREFQGKRVLVVGGGNSGCDIACDAATHADRAFISMRRGYRFLPKHIFGQPVDVFFRGGPHPPAWLAQPLLAALLRLTVGDVARYGLQPPDHKVLESHPIVNSQLLHHLAHGDITPKRDVAELRGRRVRFVDGSEEEVDLIVWATGYRASIPCLDPAALDGDGASPAAGIERALHGNLFARRHPTLFVVGHFETDGGAYPVISKQAALVAAAIRARGRSAEAAARLDRLTSAPSPDLSGGIRHLPTERHSFYVQFEAYEKWLDGMRKKVERM